MSPSAVQESTTIFSRRSSESTRHSRNCVGGTRRGQDEAMDKPAVPKRSKDVAGSQFVAETSERGRELSYKDLSRKTQKHGKLWSEDSPSPTSKSDDQSDLDCKNVLIPDGLKDIQPEQYKADDSSVPEDPIHDPSQRLLPSEFEGTTLSHGGIKNQQVNRPSQRNLISTGFESDQRSVHGTLRAQEKLLLPKLNIPMQDCRLDNTLSAVEPLNFCKKPGEAGKSSRRRLLDKQQDTRKLVDKHLRTLGKALGQTLFLNRRGLCYFYYEELFLYIEVLQKKRDALNEMLVISSVVHQLVPGKDDHLDIEEMLDKLHCLAASQAEPVHICLKDRRKFTASCSRQVPIEYNCFLKSIKDFKTMAVHLKEGMKPTLSNQQSCSVAVEFDSAWLDRQPGRYIA